MRFLLAEGFDRTPSMVFCIWSRVDGSIRGYKTERVDPR